MPIQIIWGNDTKSCENKIEKIIDSNISEQWKSFNLSKLDGNDENQVFQALEESQNAPLGDGSRISVAVCSASHTGSPSHASVRSVI